MSFDLAASMMNDDIMAEMGESILVEVGVVAYPVTGVFLVNSASENVGSVPTSQRTIEVRIRESEFTPTNAGDGDTIRRGAKEYRINGHPFDNGRGMIYMEVIDWQ